MAERRRGAAPRERAVADDYDDIRELEAGLAIDENALEEALISQPDLFYRVSKAYALQMSRRDAAKQVLQEAEAEADLSERGAGQRDDRKVTEGEIKARVQLDTRVVGARNRLAALSEDVAKLAALKEAFQQRSYALKDLVSLFIASYYTTSEHTSARTAIKDRAAGSARAAMSEERRRR